ncbi:hypothetical protein [Phaeovulum sp.]|uniref:hypothetical protein n=1 Tax=Phaeovulum sp. TaxID=2934796 RepID=UPI002AB7F8DE|nr:hypothetical protein [Phaeovulum sp.]MDZ4120740.1 hypothetical protein [Phaeovulum sp.]
MARWAHRPPSWGRVKLVFGIIAAGLLLVAVERYIGWPDWATLEPASKGVRLKPGP